MEMVERLAEDHVNAKRLADRLSGIKGIGLDTDSVKTNIVIFSVTPDLSAAKFVEGLKEAGVLVVPRGGNLFRAVTHRMIASSDVDEALVRINKTCSGLKER